MKKIFKIYFSPFLIMIISIMPWWAFSKYILKIDSSADITWFMPVILLICVGWVFLNLWVENTKNNKYSEKRIDENFENNNKKTDLRENKYEKVVIKFGIAFVVIVVFQFLLIIILFFAIF